MAPPLESLERYVARRITTNVAGQQRVEKTHVWIPCVTGEGRAYDIQDPRVFERNGPIVRALESGRQVCLSEYPSRQFFPLIVDVDLRFHDESAPTATTAVPHHHSRAFGPDFVRAIVRAYAGALATVHSAGSDGVDGLEAIVLMRPEASAGKDGVHALFPRTHLSAIAQEMVRERALDAMAVALREHVPNNTNPVANAVDDCFCKVSPNPWPVYGCGKDDRPAYAVEWMATFRATTGEVDLHAPGTHGVPAVDDWAEWISRTRVRDMRYPLAAVPLTDEASAEHDRREDLRIDAAAARSGALARALAACTDSSSAECAVSSHAGSVSERVDAARARELARLLAPERASTYEPWRNVGFALHATSPTLADAFHEFSARTTKNNYAPASVDAFWTGLGVSADGPPRSDRLKFGSLYEWAKTDAGLNAVTTSLARVTSRMKEVIHRPPSSARTEDEDESAWNGVDPAGVPSEGLAIPTVASAMDGSINHFATVREAFADPASARGEVLATTRHPIRLFFVFRRHDTRFLPDVVASQALDAVRAFLASECATVLETPFQPGIDCQVCAFETGLDAAPDDPDAVRATYVRVTFDLVVRNAAVHGELADRFARFLANSSGRFDKLVYEVCRELVAIPHPHHHGGGRGGNPTLARRTRRVRRTVVALESAKPYTVGAVIPMVGSMSREGGSFLFACEGSSPHAVDHAVVAYRGRAAEGSRLDDGSCLRLLPFEKLHGRSALARRIADRVPGQTVWDGDTARIRSLLDSWPSVRDTFPRGVRVARAREHVDGRIDAYLRGDTACPYGECGHRGDPDAPSLLRVEVARTHDEAAVVCMNAACQVEMDRIGRLIVDSGTAPGEGIVDGVDDDENEEAIRTLHPQVDAIDWAERYDEPRVRPLPHAPIVAVRSAMGTGKSEAVLALVHDKTANATATTAATASATVSATVSADPNISRLSVLLVTYSRSLASKFAAEFASAGVVSYLTKIGPLHSDRLVVCLDSICRVVRKDFDILVVDEATGVFGHMNSPHMRHGSSVWARFVELMVRARSTYFLDAALDDTGVKLLIDDVARLKGVAPYWIWNEGRFPDPRPRTAFVYTAPYAPRRDPPDPSASKEIHREHAKRQKEERAEAAAALEVAALRHIGAELVAGRRVAVCSSTSSFAEKVDVYVREKHGDKVVGCYYGAGGGSDKLADVETEWGALDALVYSPAISAGVSFVGGAGTEGADCCPVGHFHSLVVYAVNARGTPTVDTVVQMTARVRCLLSGEVHVFLAGAYAGAAHLPLTVGDVREFLRGGIRERMAPYVACDLSIEADPRWDSDARCVVYDEQCMSFNLLTAVVLRGNRSAAYYGAILRSSFRERGFEVIECGPAPVGCEEATDAAVFLKEFAKRDACKLDRVAVLTREQARSIATRSSTLAYVEEFARTSGDPVRYILRPATPPAAPHQPPPPESSAAVAARVEGRNEEDEERDDGGAREALAARAAEALFECRMRWGIREQDLDWAFFETLVATPERHDRLVGPHSHKQFTRARRAVRALRYSREQNERANMMRLRRQRRGPCANVDIYTRALDREFVVLGVAQRVLDSLFPAGDARMVAFHAREPSEGIGEAAAIEAVRGAIAVYAGTREGPASVAYVEEEEGPVESGPGGDARVGATDECSESVARVAKRYFGLTEGGLTRGVTALNNVMREAFGATVRRGSRDSRCQEYTTLVIDQTWLKGLFATYAPTFPGEEVAPGEIVMNA
jgi:Origin of replication binding protein/Primase C terminal 2 (PriCT-2)